MDAVLLDTIAACGDVNRNVMCNPNPIPDDSVHEAALVTAICACRISDAVCMPQVRAPMARNLVKQGKNRRRRGRNRKTRSI